MKEILNHPALGLFAFFIICVSVFLFIDLINDDDDKLKK